MPLDDFCSGPYDGAYNAVATGLTDDGFELMPRIKGERIAQSDAWGDSLLDYVQRGGECDIAFTCLACNAGTLNPIAIWGGSLFAGLGTILKDSIGALASEKAAALTMTGRRLLPANNKPQTMTALKAIVPESFDTRILFTSRLRKVPVRMSFLPFVDSSQSAGLLLFKVT